MIDKFATVCDVSGCGTRSDEYTSFPACLDCGEDICPTHTQPGTLHEGDGDQRDTVQCVECWAEEHYCAACNEVSSTDLLPNGKPGHEADPICPACAAKRVPCDKCGQYSPALDLHETDRDDMEHGWCQWCCETYQDAIDAAYERASGGDC